MNKRKQFEQRRIKKLSKNDKTKEKEVVESPVESPQETSKEEEIPAE